MKICRVLSILRVRKKQPQTKSGLEKGNTLIPGQCFFRLVNTISGLTCFASRSLLTLGTVIGTLADNASKKKSDHVPYRNSKLTRMLQPSLSGNARISVICTINPDASAVSESMSTLLFAKRIKSVQVCPNNPNKCPISDIDYFFFPSAQCKEEGSG